MTEQAFFVRLIALFGAALMLATPHDASAVTLRTIVTPIHQVGVGAGVSLGHAVSASTNYNRITAGGTFTATCAHPAMLPTGGQRTLSAENVAGGLSLTTTVPYWIPTIVNMPGYNEVPAGTTLSCTYNWTAKAVEGGYSVGAGGISFQTGNGERAEGSTQLFIMIVPGTSDDSDTGMGCFP
ncbi:MAG: hypothetical protein ABI821_00055 [Pseudomonadota bacterium]